MKGGHKMDCNRSNELMSLAIDQMISSDELDQLETHLLSCQHCREDYELLQSIQQNLTMIGTEEADLPGGFHAELMDRIKTIDLDASKHVASDKKVIPFWQRVNRRTMNIAAVMVFTLVFALIGVNNLDRIRQSNDSALMESATSSESMMEDSTGAAPEEMVMEAAMEVVEEAPKPEMEKSELVEATEAMPEVTSMTEATEEATMAVMNEAEQAVATSDYQEDDVSVATYGDVTSDDKELETETHLARAGTDDQKAPRSVENTLDLEFEEARTDAYATKGLVYIIFGSFLGFMLLSVFLVLRRLR